MHAFSICLCLAALALGQPSDAHAQQVLDLDAFVDDTEPLDQIDQRTSLSTAHGFMRSAELGKYELAAEYLDLRYLPEELSGADDSLFDIFVGLDFNLFNNAAVGVGINSVRMDFGVTQDDLNGDLDWQYDGALAYLKFDV